MERRGIVDLKTTTRGLAVALAAVAAFSVYGLAFQWPVHGGTLVVLLVFCVLGGIVLLSEMEPGDVTLFAGAITVLVALSGPVMLVCGGAALNGVLAEPDANPAGALVLLVFGTLVSAVDVAVFVAWRKDPGDGGSTVPPDDEDGIDLDEIVARGTMEDFDFGDPVVDLPPEGVVRH